MKWIGILLLAVFGLIACKGKEDKISSPTAKVALAVGTYRGEFMPPANTEPAEEDVPSIEEMVGILPPRLEILAENRYKMLVMGMPVEGDVVVKDQTITLSPKLILDAPPSELPEDLGLKLGGTPLSGKIGSELGTFTLDVPELDHVRLQYTLQPKIPYQPKEIRAKTDAERNILGDYKGRAVLDNSTKQKSEDQLIGERVAKSLGGNASLSLYADRRFQIALVMEMEGSWELNGNTLILNTDTVAGKSAEESGQMPEQALKFSVDQETGVLTLTNKGPGNATLQFVRK